MRVRVDSIPFQPRHAIPPEQIGIDWEASKRALQTHRARRRRARRNRKVERVLTNLFDSPVLKAGRILLLWMAILGAFGLAGYAVWKQMPEMNPARPNPATAKAAHEKVGAGRVAEKPATPPVKGVTASGTTGLTLTGSGL